MSTTTVSKGLVTKSALVAAAVVMGLSAPLGIAELAYADKWDDQMSVLNAQMSQYQEQANALNAQANTLQAQLDQITAQKNAILAQIDISQKQYDSLLAQIADTKQKIADNKDALGQIIADMYVDDSISPLEMLASSNNIGDYVDKQTQREAIQDSLSKKIDEINALQKKLEKKQKKNG
jgi:peptidoglycan hydrolase CwlO-like protein